MASSTIPIHEITPEQWEQAAVVQAELLEVSRRLIGDGFDRRIVMVGAGCALAEQVIEQCGQAEVPMYFAKLALMTFHLSENTSKTPREKH